MQKLSTASVPSDYSAAATVARRRISRDAARPLLPGRWSAEQWESAVGVSAARAATGVVTVTLALTETQAAAAFPAVIFFSFRPYFTLFEV
ncbi:hypothetical protein HPB50_020791 [Hyalomma asiaticum]|uniref:Uncharacterized protein n=1 Tax=Hyalomma asiaticum TaxID=266040 RepID=A0ACB7TNA7_HYAAI|nr:hypothetical protein HPB50_020791 [Hyalomma asiaticum]